MAVTSGTMWGTDRPISGYTCRYFIAWQQTSQSTSTNKTYINWQAKWRFVNNDAQLDNGNVVINGSSRWDNAGRLYNFSSNYTTRDLSLASGSYEITHDSNGYKTFNINGATTRYDGELSSGSTNFVLNRISKPPTVSTTTVSSIQDNQANFCGNISDTGGATVTDAGVFVSDTDATPDSNDLDADSNDNSGSFCKTLTGLSSNTLYYYRAYATNARGTSYGSVKTFTTLQLPTVTTSAVTDPAGTTATANGNLTDNGNPDVSEKGFVYNDSGSPTTSDTKAVVAGSATGVYSADLTGLSPATTYFLRAYATNSQGTVYGEDVEFLTVVLPTLTTSDATNVSTSQATGQGELVSNGSGTISERGFVWDTATAPTTSDSKVIEGGGSTQETFSKDMTGLSASENYFYRSYAINEAGTAYGNERTFSTDETAPTQPSDLDPTSGIGIDSLEPTLAWQYNAGSANDTQASYQIEVRKESDSSLMWDSTKTTSGSETADVPAGASLLWGVTYQFRVKTWNQGDLESPWSDYSLFHTSQLPVVAITNPTDTDTLVSNTPTMTWTYTDNEATTQSKWRLEILNQTGSTVIYDTDWTTGADVSYQIPDGYLYNLTNYKVRITLEDGDGMVSLPVTHSFDVAFLAPSTPTIGTPSADVAGIVTFESTINKPPVDGWYADQITIARKNTGSVSWTPLQTAIPISVVVVDDGEDETDWTESGVGTAPVSDTAKYGSQSVGLGASGAGDAIYEKTIDIPNLQDFDTIQAWIYVTDKTDFTTIDIKIGTDASNYYHFVIASGDFVDGSWNPIFEAIDVNTTKVGSPDDSQLDIVIVEIKNASGAISAGDISIDQIRLMKSVIVTKDYSTANGGDYVYGISAYSTEAGVGTSYGESTSVQTTFEEERINMYLVPVGEEHKMVKAWQNGTTPPNYKATVDTVYYKVVGSSKPIVFTSGSQDYKTGIVDLWFFDTKFNGLGESGVTSLENIRNTKPIILRTWWGKNYFISIDGSIDTTRKVGIGWSSRFTFTEIDDGQ